MIWEGKSSKIPFLVLIIALLLQACSSEEDKARSELPRMTAFEQEIFDLINKHRTESGLSLLTWDGNIQMQAMEHSRNMADKVVAFGHDGFNQRAEKIVQAIKANSVAENVAWGQTSAEQLVQGWLDSPGHRQNIEGNFNMAGLSAVQDNQKNWYYTQMFAGI